MPVGIIQRSFAGGEITKAAGARADMVKYATGLDLLRNGFIMKYGGIANRPGTKFLVEVKDSSKVTVLIPFIFNDAQTYMIEVGEFYMRFLFEEAQIVVDSGSVAAWSSGTDYVASDLVRKGGIIWYAMHASGPTSIVGAAQDPEATSGYWYQEPADGTYEIPTPYAEGHLSGLNYDQSADQVEIVHREYLPHTLSRTGHTAWTFLPTRFLPTVRNPDLGTATQAGAGTVDHRYKITAVKKQTFEESGPGHNYPITSTALTVSHGDDDLVLSDTAHDLSTGDEIYILSVLPTGAGAPDIDLIQALAEQCWIVTVIDADSFSLDDSSGLDYTVEHEVMWDLTYMEKVAGVEASEAAPVTLLWDYYPTDVGNTAEFWIYKEKNGIYGFIGNAGTKVNATGNFEFVDTGQAPNLEEVPPTFNNSFIREDKRPGVVAYFDQRLIYASSNDEPQTVWMSRAGNFRNFTIRSPLQDDDAIVFTIAGREVNEVRQLVGLGKYLLILTRGATWIARGDGDGVLRPSAINLAVQDQDGASALRALVVGNTALYVQSRGSVIRDLQFSVEVDGYQGNDLTIFAQHLFGNGMRSCLIASWAYAQIPHGIVWVVKNDGGLLGMTYLREHLIWAWHRHDTRNGLFEWVAVIPNGELDEPYFVIKRTLPSGAEVRYIEKLSPRCLACADET